MKFLANPGIDEVFSKIRLVPLGNRNIGELDFEDDGVVGANGFENPEKLVSFAKALAQSKEVNFLNDLVNE
nr:auxin response factor 8 [Quercus suber]